LLEKVAGQQLARLTCFDAQSSAVDRGAIETAPHLCFIDGEHTAGAALADFELCHGVAHEQGLICFHDAWIVAPAIRRVKRRLRKRGALFVGTPLLGSLYVIALGGSTLLEAAPLAEMRRGELMFHLRAGLRRRHHRWVMQPLRRRNLMRPGALRRYWPPRGRRETPSS
jgi:hypothetical protein